MSQQHLCDAGVPLQWPSLPKHSSLACFSHTQTERQTKHTAVSFFHFELASFFQLIFDGIFHSLTFPLHSSVHRPAAAQAKTKAKAVSVDKGKGLGSMNKSTWAVAFAVGDLNLQLMLSGKLMVKGDNVERVTLTVWARAHNNSRSKQQQNPKRTSLSWT